ncbi:MAG: hypothetical protein GXY12_12390 [Clostridiaceae bacterium]|nr:hypothetical protein [Clostridiaceae bacterium]
MNDKQRMGNNTKQTEQIPVMKAEHFINWISPEINQDAYKAQRKHKRRMETLSLILGYLFFLFFAGIIYLDYRVNGMLNLVPLYLYSAGVLSLGLIIYIPLLIKFKKVN